MQSRLKRFSLVIAAVALVCACNQPELEGAGESRGAQVAAASREVASPNLSLETASLDHAAVGASTSSVAISEGTRRMVERLAALRTADPPSRFDSRRHVVRLRAELAQPQTPAAKMYLTAELANELLRSGLPEEAMQTVVAVLDSPEFKASPQAPRVRRLVREFEALAHLRIGERENCVHRHGVESCLIPIRGSGVHSDQAGSRAAMAIYDDLLAEDPDSKGLMWLRNIAAMTLGEYPDKVPARIRVPPSIFESEYDIRRFKDVAQAAGLMRQGHAGGSIVEDLDGDGDLDVVASGWLLDDALEVYRNEGDGTFTNHTEASGIVGINGGLNIVHADYDNDGDADILVLRGAWNGDAGRYPNSLLRNRGNLVFEDVTEAAGLLTLHPTQVGVWADYDNDGWLDLFIGNESDESRHASELWHNNRNGTFSNRIELLGETMLGFVKGAGWGDYDNDGRPDLVVTGQGMRPRLYHNDGPGDDTLEWRFTDVATELGVTEPQSAFSNWFFDYDNDGRLDLLIAGYTPVDVSEIAKFHLGLPNRNEPLRLFRNTGAGFEDVSVETRINRAALTMGANYGDLDNDGWLDLYAGTGAPNLDCLIPNRMFRNASGAVFQDVTTSGGFGHIQKGHAISFADIDEDGDQDVFTVMGGAYFADTAHNALYENPGHGNHWLKLRLEGRRANRGAIGARIRVRVKTPVGMRDIYSTVSTGGSFGASPLRREIGLGDATGIDLIAVTWPGETEPVVYTDALLDRYYRLVEGGGLEELELHRSTLGGDRQEL